MNAVDQIEIVKFSPALRHHFGELNKEWIEKYFEMEARDEYVLSEPEEAILQYGGKIFYAKCNDRIVGTCALVLVNEDTFEISKMAVTYEHQGRGVGKALMEHVIGVARKKRLKQLILYSNSSLKAAVGMYKQFGFKEIPKLDFHSKRSNLKMILTL
ncbi:MAG TPA: GNAT family N-acetyltransferase [Cyclobacteriaceae bacterium]|nr:GNAT family N-acetyltransferase [Cyclobacteriaceae bacterium]